MAFLKCLLYLLISGICVFLLGRIFPRKWITENSFPFKSFSFEKNGKIYEKIGIKRWKTKLPDASLILYRFIPKLMPKKRLKVGEKEKISVLVKETCVAETTHFLAAVMGLYCAKIWRGGGLILSLLYFIWNLPFVLIQRYNRPRLMRVCALT